MILAQRTIATVRHIALLGAITCLASVPGISIAVAQGQSQTPQPYTKRDIEFGRRIYREGILPSGKPIRAIVQGDVAIEGTQFSCAGCHRFSGFGSNEGGRIVPPVTGSLLYQARKLQRADLVQNMQESRANSPPSSLRDPRMRPAYTDESLATVLRDGKDPSGRELDPLMPRYALSNEEMGFLMAYLKTLSSSPATGVDKSMIHFATVVTEGVDAEKRKAMLDVIEGYFRWKNAETKQALLKPGFSFMFKDSFLPTYREWMLHVWELKGPKQTWFDQLKAYYREQPVFALLSGIGAGDWRPVHEFSEWAELPCLFPNIDLPVISPTGIYTIYFSKGLTIEAEALARYLYNRLGPGHKSPIIQVFRRTEIESVPARALRHSLEKFGITSLQDLIIEDTQRFAPPLLNRFMKSKRASIVVLWLEYPDLKSREVAEAFKIGADEIYLSYSLLKGMPPPLPENIRDKIRLTYPFILPHIEMPQLYRVRGWMAARGIKMAHERIQVNTYFALSVADHSLRRLVGNFSRDYFMESVEHKTEEVPNPGVFPHLSLGPGQRFAAKGSYMVKLSGSARGGLEAISDWIIP
jgi:hypothetical protein